MKNAFLVICLVLVSVISTWFLARNPAKWSGVDETVVEKFAEEAGRPPSDPYINTDQGDLLLFFFLLAGIAGGAVGGYYFRELFPPLLEESRKTKTP